ncbi:helix-turn-helix domain-containing protein [Saccharopolyspora sp. NPDC002686]|uniref:TetR/AcrR family transcriptional regulator n=1 Tax=Saccharopolyspora sp. NPDC002686 TaxID=3154541 RepID=UPI0033258922
MSPVNKRAEKAKQTRLRMLRAAGELFVERGYGATPLQDIADRAGVAVQTIYFTFRNKRNLLKEVVDTAIAGDDEPVATMDRQWFRDALAEETAQAHLRAHIAGTRQVLERVAAIVEVLRVAAATDPEVVDLWPKGEDPRYTVQAATAKSLVTKPGARADLSVDHAADVLFGLLSPELYLLLVRDRGWTPDQWEQWAYDTLRAQLVS